MDTFTDTHTVSLDLPMQVFFRDGKPDTISVGDRTIWTAGRGVMDPAMGRTLADIVARAARSVVVA